MSKVKTELLLSSYERTGKRGKKIQVCFFLQSNKPAIKFHNSFLCFFNLSFHLRSVGSFWSLTLETSFWSDESFHTWTKTTGFHITALVKSTWRKEHDKKTDREVRARRGTQRCINASEAGRTTWAVGVLPEHGVHWKEWHQHKRAVKMGTV